VISSIKIQIIKMKRASTTVEATKDTSPNKQSKQQLGNFQVSPIGQYNGKLPFYRQPVEFGQFSLDGKRTFMKDNSQLRYYVTPKQLELNFDLRKGYDTAVIKDDEVKERLTHLLTWVKHNKKKFQLNDEKPSINKKESLNTDFISWRGHFTKFLLTPYENREPWKMGVTLFNGTIFISEIETEKSKHDRLNRSAKNEEMCYWGYKFEDYLTQSVHDNVEKSSNVNTNEAFCSVVRTRLEQHSILIGAEVDCCIKNNKNKPPSNYIELKTTRIMYNERQETNFARFKLKKFWGQSFLAGVPKVIVGMRDDSGIVKELKTYDTLNIPNIVRQYGNFWEASVCLTFLNKFLSWLKETVRVDNADVVYIVSFNEPFDVINVRLVEDGSERFLPKWFTDEN